MSVYRNVKIALNVGEGMMIPEDFHHVLAQVRDQEDLLNEVRRIIDQAEPSAVGLYGLTPTLSRIVERADKFTKLRNLLGLI